MARVIDLDVNAPAREGAGEPIVVLLNRREWTLPPEFPASVLDPLFEGELDDLLALLIELIGDGDTERVDFDPMKLLPILARNPALLSTTLRAIRRAFSELLGEEQWAQWLAGRPGLGDYFRLGRAAFGEYGVSLGEALGLSPSADTGGTTSKPTSKPAGTTRGGSGSRRGTRS
ncbi:hypothetical protein [Micromonospora aurantiaca (nom. illeg.)]|uniref:hypothetical protein n=1 Tax=Micromonospora aurantiaca (nom. illeg.) TaxID=47850 RepID=UPI0011A0D552|nr:hypothetical protein [Micromonospora aurantiaca]MBC9000507.1 hypothetical protein [Micromonospora aurantiaca]